jgi:excisionase family DNA binding protein
MPHRGRTKKHRSRNNGASRPDVLDVNGIAALLTVSADTVYDLLKSGELPGRKVGRKWLTTRSAVMRWIEQSLEAETAQRALDTGDKAALTKALQSGAVRVKGGRAVGTANDLRARCSVRPWNRQAAREAINQIGIEKRVDGFGLRKSLNDVRRLGMNYAAL